MSATSVNRQTHDKCVVGLEKIGILLLRQRQVRQISNFEGGI